MRSSTHGKIGRFSTLSSGSPWKDCSIVVKTIVKSFMAQYQHHRNIEFSAMALTATAFLLGGLPLSAQITGPDFFTRTVVVGDSLSAGFQNFSLFDSNPVPPTPAPPAPGGQQYGFAAVVAQQAGHGLTLPLFAYPGVPANFFLYPSPLFGREN